MVAALVQALGGLGIFLMGMVVMTQGLRELAGDAMREALMRFTRSPTSGAISGTLTTALLQSSSATTVAAVGFVSAGLMSFSQALGVIFGANLGTTITGWLVVLLGFKLQLGELVLPLIFAGVVMRLFGARRWSAAGFALAGFSLLFVGLATLQEGVADVGQLLDPQRFGDDSMSGRLKLLLLGMGVTVITQSSSAGVAAALSALHADLIQFEQAAALIIGMDVGTTVTAALAAVGGGTGARRTGLSHVIFNVFTGVLAFAMISPYVTVSSALYPHFIGTQAEIALVVFHSVFNLIGVAMVLPVARPFARFVETVVPDKSPRFTGGLSSALLEQPKQALAAVHTAVREEIYALLGAVVELASSVADVEQATVSELKRPLDDTQAYIDNLHFTEATGAQWEQLVALVHTLDHLQRLQGRCQEESQPASTAATSTVLARERTLFLDTARRLLVLIENNHWADAAQLALNTETEIRERVEPLRTEIVHLLARDELNIPQANRLLGAVRWMKRVSTHLARICHHYREAVLAAGQSRQGGT